MTRAPRRSSTSQAAEVERLLGGPGRRLHTFSGGAAVAAVAQAAVHHVGGARWASVSLLRGRQVRTLVATAPAAQHADALQLELGAGPLLLPAPEGAVHLAGTLSRDRRWPVLAGRLGERLGVAGLLAYRLPLPEEPGTTVGLTLYAETPDAFDGQALWAGGLLAEHCVQAVAAEHHRRRTEQLEQGLRSARDTGTAVGVLMARHGAGREEALEMLRAAAQDAHRPLAEIAAEVVEAQTRRLPPVPAGPHAPPRPTPGAGP